MTPVETPIRPTPPPPLRPAGGNPPNTAAGDERRDVVLPLVALTFLVAAIALVIAFTASQSPASSATAAPATTAASTSKIIRPQLDKATDDNFDIVATRFDPTTAPVAPGAKTFDLSMEEQRVKIGDRVTTLWTFNETAPGPVLRAVEGDQVTINITNNAKSTMVHSIDFHASRMSMGGGEVQVAPGDTGTFTFTAEYPGVFMYHCATPPVLEHIGRGMYGMLIVQPKEGFGPKMPEYAIVQSELYRDFVDMQAGNEAAVVMNGIPKQYADEPIIAAQDTPIRLFFLNAGPSKLSSFHIVGTVFDKVYADGNPANLTVGQQALAVPASGGLTLEFELVGEGKFPFVTHQFHDVDSGAVGMFQTGDGSLLSDGKAAAATHSGH